jgi:hypothetical protein
LQRPFLYDRHIFVTVKLLPWKGKLNPVKRGLVKRPEEWKWSSFPKYTGVDTAEQQCRCGLTIDRVRLPADENAKI